MLEQVEGNLMHTNQGRFFVMVKMTSPSKACSYKHFIILLAVINLYLWLGRDIYSGGRKSFLSDAIEN